jgi:hypothetical protein
MYVWVILFESSEAACYTEAEQGIKQTQATQANLGKARQTKLKQVVHMN